MLAALKWEPGINAAQIGVTVSDGVVTLRGTVSSLEKKWIAERAARRLSRVRAIADDLDVSPIGNGVRSDSAIAAAEANALEWDSAVPDGAVKVTVRNGWITLTGSVQHQFEQSAAELAVRRLHGVKGVANSILIKPRVSAGDIEAQIDDALKRSAAAARRQGRGKLDPDQATRQRRRHQGPDRRRAQAERGNRLAEDHGRGSLGIGRPDRHRALVG
jgi:osmotically-inducible protein OsmY